jgi:hypothetical protein
MAFDLSEYVDVAERIRLFREKHPEGSLQSTIRIPDDGSWVLCKAYAYRTPNDERPGIGHSRLTIPGKTPYTKDSEVENAETSAWGRAIVAALAADTKKVASADEVAAHETPAAAPQAGGAVESAPPVPAPTPEPKFVAATKDEKAALVAVVGELFLLNALTEEQLDTSLRKENLEGGWPAAVHRMSKTQVAEFTERLNRYLSSVVEQQEAVA